MFCSKDWKTVQPSSPMASGKEMCWVQLLPPSSANTLLWSPELLTSLPTLSLPTPTPLRKSSAGLGQIPIFASLPHLQSEGLGSPGCGGPSPKHLLLAQMETLPGVPPKSCLGLFCDAPRQKPLNLRAVFLIALPEQCWNAGWVAGFPSRFGERCSSLQKTNQWKKQRLILTGP